MAFSSNPTPTEATIIKTLKVSGFDYTDNVWWRNDDEGNLRLFIKCSDFFYWGTADLEEITDANVDELVATVAECESIMGKYDADDAFLLWCCRQRKLRPQGACYKNIDEELWHLFDAAGPERENGLGNPAKAPKGTST